MTRMIARSHIVGIAVMVVVAGLSIAQFTAARQELPASIDTRSILIKVPSVRLQNLAAVSTDFHSVGLARIAKQTHANYLERLSTRPNSRVADYLVVRFEEDVDVEKTLDAFAASPGVELAEPNTQFQSHYTPNDYDADTQWNFELVGARQAWDYDTTSPKYGGDPDVIVAVIDTGVAYEDAGAFDQAPDLVNTSFTDGRTFLGAEEETSAHDDNGHGTHVAGTIAQSTNNSSGVTGLAFRTTIMPIKVLDNEGNGDLEDVVQGINYAVANGADVINLSLGSPDGSNALDAAIDDAVDAGVLIVASSGNDGATTIAYPARYDAVIAVGAVGSEDDVASYSNRASQLDLVAPGGSSTTDTWVYQQTYSNINNQGLPRDFTTFGLEAYRGTSMAAPHVSAAAALLLAYGVENGDVESTLTSTAVDLETPGHDTKSGYGRLDIAGAFALAAGDQNAPSNPTSIKAWTNQNRDKQLRENTRSADRTPYFSWSGADDGGDGSGVVGYYVYFGTNAIANPEVRGIFQTSNRYDAGTLTSRANDKSYYLRIKTKDQAGNVTGTVMTFEYVLDTLSARPKSVSARDRASGVEITWTNPESHAAFYRVYRARSENGTFSYLGRTMTNSYVDGSVRDTDEYYYQITTVDDLDNASDASNTFHLEEADYLVVGAGPGHSPEVSVFRSDGTLVRRFMAFNSEWTCGVNVASGDTNSDGQDEIIAGTGPGCRPEVKVFNRQGLQIVPTFVPYADYVLSGVFVASGNVDSDREDEIITGVRENAGPHVRVFNGAGRLEHTLGWFAYQGAVRNGVYPAVGRIKSNEPEKIYTGVEGGHGSHVRPWNHRGENIYHPGWFAYGGNVGVHPAIGDFDGDGQGEIATVPADSALNIRFFKFYGDTDINSGWTAFQGEASRGGFLAAVDYTRDGTDELAVTVATDGPPKVKIYSSSGTLLKEFIATTDSGFRGGLPLASGHNLD